MIVLKSDCEYFEEVKKSKFTAMAHRAESIAEAENFIKSVRQENASHNAWAYKIGKEYRFNDDGEVSGTAGKPIFSAIEYSGLDEIVIVVIRFFGGIKLGAGGLVRAYGGVATECLKIAETVELVPEISVCVKVGFAAMGAVFAVIDKLGGARGKESFSENGVEIEVCISESDFEGFKQAVCNATLGQAIVLENNN
jgi:uncharacterized YigZ family protein